MTKIQDVTKSQNAGKTQSVEKIQSLEQWQNLYPFNNKVEEQLFNKVSKELRCTVCQNQSIFDSIAPIAVDLRREIYRQVRAGQSEVEIVAFVVDRYGEAILYNPPWQINTSLLWAGPALMLIIGFLMLAKNFKFSNQNKNK